MSRENIRPEVERFWEKVNKNGPTVPGMTTPCWVWTAGITYDGYGGFYFFKKQGTAHRFSYLLHKGQIPKGMEVRHICHNPICVNPDHLRLGTHIDNMKDLALSGRRKGFRVKYKRPLKYKPTAEERFWAKVNKDGPFMPNMNTPCWQWLAYLDPIGYGRISVNRKIILAHRFSYILFNGLIPDGLDVLHKCDNPTCVNPEHLFLGTHTDNMQDMASKGRTGTKQGEDSPFSKLTEEQVREIKNRYVSTDTSQVQLAKEYGVSQAAIWYILKGRNWASLT